MSTPFRIKKKKPKKKKKKKKMPVIAIEKPLIIIGFNLNIDNYYINSKNKMNYVSQYNKYLPLTEYGLYMNKINHRN